MKKKLFTVLGILSISVLFYGLGYSLGQDRDKIFENLDIFAEAITAIEEKYVEETLSKDLIYGALKGMLTSLDVYSQFLTPEDYKNLMVETEGEFGGLGIQITIRKGVLTIISPMEGTPAWEAGIQPGDVIVEIDGESTEGITLQEAVRKLRGEPGAEVTLTILQEGRRELWEVEITRDIIKIEDIKEALILKDDIGYVRISEFREATAQDLKESLKELRKKDMRGLILDVRNNPGGLLSSAVDVASLFLEKEKPIVSTDSRSQREIEFKAQRYYDQVADIPIIVLINKGSASGSEILAAALRDHKRAVLMGEPTFGKGSVQTIVPLSDGSALRLTTSRYYTPAGIGIHEDGIEPDILVTKKHIEEEEDIFRRLEKENDFDYEKDYQIIRALDLIKGLLALSG